MRSRMSAAGIGLAMCLALGAPALAEQAPERSSSGTTLVVPESERAAGRVYHLRYPGHSAQVTFTSEAPLERIVGTTNRVVGYLVAEVDDDGALTGGLRSGAFRLPVASLRSGIPLRDEHMRSERFLHASAHPEVTFVLESTTDIERVREDNGVATYSLTLVGEMTIKGTTRLMRVPARVVFMPESDQTRLAGQGDALALRCSYTIDRADFGIAPNFVTADLADVIEIDQFLVLTTSSRHDRVVATPNGELLASILHAQVLLEDFADTAAAAETARRVLEDASDNAAALETLAWELATTDGAAGPLLRICAEAAERAVALTERESGPLATLARVRLEQGRLDEAVTLQREAVSSAASEEQRHAMQATLDRYEAEAAGR